MLSADNLEEYRFPELYDLENPDFEPEGLFYLSLAQELGGPVLELGCGTGRMTIPLAQHGVQITGLDLVPAMLERARSRAGDLPIEWVQADVRTFHLERRFRLIFENGSVFMHMLTRADQQAFLARVREHLAPHARCVLSLLFPHPDYLASQSDEAEWFSYQDEHGRTVKVSGFESYDGLNQIKTETAIRRIFSPGGALEAEYSAPLRLRYTFPQEMEALLEQAGLRPVARYGNLEGEALTQTSKFMVFVVVADEE